MEGGAVGPNSSPLGDEERKVQMFQFLEETQVVQWTEVSFPLNQYPKLLFVKGVFLYYEGQTQGLTLSMPSLTMTEVGSHIHLHCQEMSLVQNSGSCKFRNP